LFTSVIGTALSMPATILKDEIASDKFTVQQRTT